MEMEVDLEIQRPRLKRTTIDGRRQRRRSERDKAGPGAHSIAKLRLGSVQVRGEDT